MGRIDIARGHDHRTSLRADVIQDPGERPCGHGKRDQRALADQSWSAGERTITAIGASTVRCPVSGVSTSILNTTG